MCKILAIWEYLEYIQVSNNGTNIVLLYKTLINVILSNFKYDIYFESQYRVMFLKSSAKEVLVEIIMVYLVPNYISYLYGLLFSLCLLLVRLTGIIENRVACHTVVCF